MLPLPPKASIRHRRNKILESFRINLMKTHRSRLYRRLFYCLILLALAVSVAHAVPPATTTVTDTVYRADGSPASGTLLITWPAFTAADGSAVAAGSMSVTLGSAGAFNAGLVPNAGANPAGTYYKVVYKLDDQTTSTEYWSVPATSPATIGAIRSLVVPTSVAAQFVSKSYVDTQVAPKANDAAVVHTAGSESITGVKQFSVPPSVPTPINTSDAANKSYIDSLPVPGPGPCGVSQYVFALNNRVPPTCRGIGGIRFADQYVSLQAAVADAGTSGSVIIPHSYTGTDTYSNPNNINITDLRGAPDRNKGFVNVVADCGATGNGVTDDSAAIQGCINNNPGKRIFFPKMAASCAGGGPACAVDYFLASPLTVSANGAWLDGETPATWIGSVILSFAPGIRGIRLDQNCYSCKISNLQLIGGNDFSSTVLADFEDWRGTEAALFQNDGHDGIQLLGGEPRLENVFVESFQRHCIYISGDSTIASPTQPDFWRFDRVTVDACRGNGVYVNGGDSNAGVATMLDARNNAVFGVEDNAPLGNTFEAVGTHTNHRDAIAAGITQNVSTNTVSGNVATIVTSSSLANGTNAVGTWVTTAGQSDPTFNGPCKVLTASGSTMTCNFTHANGGATGGSIRTSTSTEVYNAWAAAGINGGAIGGSDALGTWIQPYVESGQGVNNISVRLPTGAVVIGSNTNPSLNQDLSYGVPTWIHGGTSPTTYVSTATGLIEPQDASLRWQFQAGQTAEQLQEIDFYERTGTTKEFQIQKLANNTGVVQIPSGAEIAWLPSGPLQLFSGGSAAIQLNSSAQVLAGGNFYNASTTIPAFTLNTPGTHFIHFYNGNASNVLKIGFASGISTNPASPVFTLPEVGAAVFANPVQAPAVNSGSSSNTDLSGTLTLSGGTAAYTFAQTYASHPACVASDETSISPVKVTYTSTTSVTFTTSGATDVIDYICHGRN
jgi:hypothetical protein